MRQQLIKPYKWLIRQTPVGSVQKRLGFSENTKLLIIHADDMGLTASENEATFQAMSSRTVNSGSVMVPCSHFNDVADYSKAHPGSDIGVHLTLTNEWPLRKLKPLLPAEQVPGIVDSNGSFLPVTSMVAENPELKEIRNEMHAQIKKAIDSGIDLTHIDSHMFVAFAGSGILKEYLSLGREFRLPLLLTYDLPLKTWLFKKDIFVDNLYCATSADYKKGLNSYYRETIRSLTPGLNVILVHIAFDNEEMRKLTGDQADFGSAWRQADFDYFTGKECRQLLDENDIRLITWRYIRDKMYPK